MGLVFFCEYLSFGDVFGMAVALYSIIPQEHLHKVLQTLQAYTELPIQVLDQNGDILCRFGQCPQYCTLLNQRVFANNQSAVCCSKPVNTPGRWERHIFSPVMPI